MNKVNLSVLLPSMGRHVKLLQAINNLRTELCGLTSEIIVVYSKQDKGDTPGWAVIANNNDDNIICIEQGGTVVAGLNKACELSWGKYMTWASDDLIYQPGCFKKSIEYMESKQDKQMLAGVVFDHNCSLSEDNSGYHVHYNSKGIGNDNNKYPFLNFGLIRMDIFRKIGLFDESYIGYFSDTDVNMALWKGGYSLDVLDDCRVVHSECNDQTRENNMKNYKRDKEIYQKKWGQKNA